LAEQLSQSHIEPVTPEGLQMFDDLIDRRRPGSDPARVGAVIASDRLHSAAAAARSESSAAYRMANVLNAMLLQAFCDRLSKYGDKMLTLFADGQAVEVPVFF
jgi:hypothetical protein